MARKKRARRKRKFTIPVAPVLGLVAGITSPAHGFSTSPITHLQAGRYEEAVKQWTSNYTGFGADGQFSIQRLSKGLLPLAAGLMVHKFVGGNPLNLNRTLASAGVPYIRL